MTQNISYVFVVSNLVDLNTNEYIWVSRIHIAKILFKFGSVLQDKLRLSHYSILH